MICGLPVNFLPIIVPARWRRVAEAV